MVALVASPAVAQQIAGSSTTAPPLVPLTTRWPATMAVATIKPGLTNPTAIEATSDGWVVLTPLSSWSQAREGGPHTRLRARPEEARRWAAAARRLLGPARDSLPDERQARQLPPLGRGQAYVRAHVGSRTDPLPVSFQLRRCDGVFHGYNVTPHDIGWIAGYLEHAADAAERGSAVPVMPTQDRPYYGSEVSCAALPAPANAPPRFPDDLPPGERRHAEVGVRLVVDTLGRVEPGSIATVAGAPPRLARAARTLVAGWRYRPATWYDRPVRQVVTAVLVFDPDAPVPSAPAFTELTSGRELPRQMGDGVTVTRAEADGWVHVRKGYWEGHGRFVGYQEWYHPDSVDAWLVRVDSFLTADSIAPRRPPPPFPELAIGLGPAAGGNRIDAGYPMGWAPETEFLPPQTMMRGCGSAPIQGEMLDRAAAARFATAAREARTRRPSPAPVAARVYLSGELACAAHLAPVSARRAELPGTWSHPVAAYPSSLEPTNAIAEVFSSFEVDTTGTADPATLVVMAGSDPRAVAALHESLASYRFQPAARGGAKVRTRVYRLWHFVPPPLCVQPDAGVACPRPEFPRDGTTR